MRILIPSSDKVRNILLAMPTCERIPTPTTDTLETFGSPEISLAKEISGDPKVSKVSVVGVGMRSHVGIASKMFRTLSEEGINILMISTSEIKISVVIDEKYMELAVRALHKAFELDQK